MKIKNIISTTLICLPLIANAVNNMEVEPDWNYHFITTNESLTFKIDKFYLQDNFRAICFLSDQQEHNDTGLSNNERENEEKITNIIPPPATIQITTSNYCPRKEFYDYITPSVRNIRYGVFYLGENGEIKQRGKDYAYITFTVLPTAGNIKPFVAIKCQN